MSSSVRDPRLGILQLERKGHMVDRRYKEVEEKEDNCTGLER